jgi:hypothetical protein
MNAADHMVEVRDVEDSTDSGNANLTSGVSLDHHEWQ